jgi:hypothetical protein
MVRNFGTARSPEERPRFLKPRQTKNLRSHFMSVILSEQLVVACKKRFFVGHCFRITFTDFRQKASVFITEVEHGF